MEGWSSLRRVGQTPVRRIYGDGGSRVTVTRRRYSQADATGPGSQRRDLVVGVEPNRQQRA